MLFRSPGKSNEVFELPAIDEVGVGNHTEPAEAEDEWVPAVRRGTDQAQAAVISVCSKQFDLGRLQIFVRANIGCDRLDMSARRPSAKCWDSHEASAAVACVTLGFQYRERMRFRRNIEIGHVLMLERERNEQRPMASKCWLHVPVADVASDFDLSVAGNG